jgi:hypothetical protein
MNALHPALYLAGQWLLCGQVAAQITIITLRNGLSVESGIGFVAYSWFGGWLSPDDRVLFGDLSRLGLRIMDEKYLPPW